MGRQTFLTLIGVIFMVISPLCSFAADWVTVKCVEGEFAAEFPASPKEQRTRLSIAGQVIYNHNIGLARKDGREYAVNWSDYPQEVMQRLTPERIFDNIVKGYATGGKTILSDKLISLDGRPGRRLEVDMGNGIIHQVIVVMSGSRLYNVMTYSATATKDDPDISKFLASFSIINIRDFAPRGFRLENVELAGWHSALRDKGKTVIQWLSPDSAPDNVRGFITVEAAPPSISSAEKTAQGLAKNWNGKVLSKTIMLDGEPAFQVEAINNTKELRPVEGIVAMHHGYAYLIMGGMTSGGNCARQIAEIAKGWKWEALQPTSEHLKQMSNPIPIFGGLATLDFPEDMYFNRAEKPNQVVDLSLYDIQHNSGAFQAYVQLVPLPQGVPFATLKDSCLKELNSRFETDIPMVWTARNGDSSMQVTQAAKAPKMTESLKHDTYIKFALIQLDREHLCLINFTITAENEKEKALFDAASVAIVDSVIPLPATTNPNHD